MPSIGFTGGASCLNLSCQAVESETNPSSAILLFVRINVRHTNIDAMYCNTIIATVNKLRPWYFMHGVEFDSKHDGVACRIMMHLGKCNNDLFCFWGTVIVIIVYILCN